MAHSVLVVDDEVELAETIADIFAMEGYETFVANNGLVALDVLSQKKIDLIISDAKMPKMSGPDLSKKLLDEGKKIGFVLVTGYTETSVDDLKSLGIDFMISKPMDTQQLLEKAAELIKTYNR